MAYFTTEIQITCTRCGNELELSDITTAFGTLNLVAHPCSQCMSEMHDKGIEQGKREDFMEVEGE